MIPAEIHREEIPPGTPNVEWINTTNGWLYLHLPDCTQLSSVLVAAFRSPAPSWHA